MAGVRALEKAPELTKIFNESDLYVKGKNRFEEKEGMSAVRSGGCRNSG